ncbi:universal stress protein [Candidatus Nitronereus thalassa]|uniref:Universal stress protein n=1 Tax=Candidatus Nitronereus thalassa TaxID=3020898 RepID=A0ABU3K464_9BACT|nr:universal stress protein [Candidatus Nitronereus thalassa]MDT7041153.1 universal stress protein [Candidatus Nitronereus thalassa]
MKILWSVDFSRDSKAAIRCLSGVDFPKGSEGLLLHVISKNEELRRLGHISDFAINLSQLQQKTIERVHRNLKKLADRFLPSTLSRSILVREGNPGKEILTVLNKEHLDLAVLGTRGVTGINRFLLGSVSDWILQEAPCPVLIARGAGRKEKRGMRIVLATDGSSKTEIAVEFINQLSFPPNSEIVLFHVIEPIDYTIVQDDYRTLGLGPSGLQELQKLVKEVHGRRKKSQESLLKQTKKSLTLRKGKVEHIAVGYAAEEIVKAAYRFRADLVVIGSRGLTGVKRTLLGSVSSRVVRHAPCSVLVVRKNEKSKRVRI